VIIKIFSYTSMNKNTVNKWKFYIIKKKSE
jgi:hypothetical protein